jgi:TetR/AcrR family transcriptional regulator, cholesterol catabolism regulator
MVKPRRSGNDSGEVVVRRGVLNEARWEQILQAAANEFYERGFKGARLQDIASRVGLLTGSLYYYIESKENLLFALVDTAFRKGLDAMVEDSATANSPAPARLHTFIRHQMHVLEDTQSASLVVVARDRKYLAPEHREQFDIMRSQLRNHVTGILDQGIAAGDFDPMIDVDVVTNSVFALMNTTSEWARDAGQASWDAIAEWYARLFLRSLAPSTHDVLSEGATAAVNDGS